MSRNVCAGAFGLFACVTQACSAPNRGGPREGGAAQAATDAGADWVEAGGADSDGLDTSAEATVTAPSDDASYDETTDAEATVTAASDDAGNVETTDGWSDSPAGPDMPGCAPGLTLCVDGGLLSCGADGRWGGPMTCATRICVDGACTGSTTAATSCQVSGPGLDNCGPGDSGTESCCTSLEVPGGAFYNYPADPDASPPAGRRGLATVSGFRLDKYDVTVGRFRQFVNAVLPPDGGAGWRPPEGSGKHAHLNGGLGLANAASDAGPAYEPGWATADNGEISPTNANLGAPSALATWTGSPGTNENQPIVNLNWCEAYAFCIWDGGFLPSAIEWGYAASGGSEQRDYPWGSTDPGTDNQYEIDGRIAYDNSGHAPAIRFFCNYPGPPNICEGASNIAPVGTPSSGSGRWGQLDLVGNVFQWTLDWYGTPGFDPCVDCASLTPMGYLQGASPTIATAFDRKTRGGAYDYDPTTVDTAFTESPFTAGISYFRPPASRDVATGVRCARDPYDLPVLDAGSVVVSDAGGDDGARSVLDASAAAGPCTAGAAECSGPDSVQICGPNGQWTSPWACATGMCVAGACAGATTSAPSCPGAGYGLTNCGATSESCCTSEEVPGGTYDRTYTSDANGNPTGEADPATVSGFRLDKYLVTVGRFRQFVNYLVTGGSPPEAGAGKHVHLNGGLGLVNSASPGSWLANSASAGNYESGWDATDWNTFVEDIATIGWPSYPINDSYQALCQMAGCETTWTTYEGTNENQPIDFVNWYEAYAFCIWDGGFLPSEAEWEFAAAGGGEQREYPWGSTDPGTSLQYAIYSRDYPYGQRLYPVAPVGTATLGAGRWGQLDLTGQIAQWILDYYYSGYIDPCTDCAETLPGPAALRAGDYGLRDDPNFPYSWYRNYASVTDRGIGTWNGPNVDSGYGFRCARTP